MPDRKWVIAVGTFDQAPRHEIMAGNGSHHFEHGRVTHTTPLDLALDHFCAALSEAVVSGSRRLRRCLFGLRAARGRSGGWAAFGGAAAGSGDQDRCREDGV